MKFHLPSRFKSSVRDIARVWSGNLSTKASTSVQDREASYGYFIETKRIHHALSAFTSYARHISTYLTSYAQYCDLSRKTILYPESYQFALIQREDFIMIKSKNDCSVCHLQTANFLSSVFPVKDDNHSPYLLSEWLR